jgi:hypothetical protein
MAVVPEAPSIKSTTSGQHVDTTRSVLMNATAVKMASTAAAPATWQGDARNFQTLDERADHQPAGEVTNRSHHQPGPTRATGYARAGSCGSTNAMGTAMHHTLCPTLGLATVTYEVQRAASRNERQDPAAVESAKPASSRSSVRAVAATSPPCVGP